MFVEIEPIVRAEANKFVSILSHDPGSEADRRATILKEVEARVASGSVILIDGELKPRSESFLFSTTVLRDKVVTFSDWSLQNYSENVRLLAKIAAP